MGAQSNVHLHNVPSHKMLKDRTTLTDVEQPSQFPYLLCTNLHGGHRFPKFGTCSGLPPQIPQGTVSETPTCHIFIYDHFYIYKSSFRTKLSNV